MKPILWIIAFVFILLAAHASAQECQPNEQQPCNYPSIGECVPGVQYCENGRWGLCFGGRGPTQEICNDNNDNDCDDQIDEGCECGDGQAKTCGPDREVGICRFGRQACNNSMWGICINATYPFPNDLCGTNGAGNSLDDDCDGQTDEGCTQLTANATTNCFNGIKDGDEEGIDCGGSCRRCPTCNDQIQNQNETGVDCGGPCLSCASCSDGVQNQNETGVDCGGACRPCVKLEDTDDDNDWLIYVVELHKGTDPDNPDTDGDGLNDRSDPTPICPNAVCDIQFGETKKNCPQDCRKTNVTGLIVVMSIIVLFFLIVLLFYRKTKSHIGPRSDGLDHNALPKFDVTKYKESVSKEPSSRKSKVDDELEKSLKNFDKILKR